MIAATQCQNYLQLSSEKELSRNYTFYMEFQSGNLERRLEVNYLYMWVLK